jgi:hypothetical protein
MAMTLYINGVFAAINGVYDILSGVLDYVKNDISTNDTTSLTYK